MANWIRLYIGKKEALSWPWYIPEFDKPILRFVFTRDDLEVTSEDSGTCALKITVSEVKKRLDRFHLTTSEIDKTIADLLGLPSEKVELAVMDLDEFFETYPEPDIDDKKKHYAWETFYNKKSEIDRKKDRTNLGHLVALRHVRKMLDDSEDEEIVRLWYEYSPEDVVNEMELFLESYTFMTELERRYLENAKVHLTTEDFDLVYIELIIALESAVKKYITRKSRELLGRTENSINLESMTKDLSLINLIRFGIVYIGKSRLDKSAMESLEKTYSMRNNVVHNRARRFKISDVAESIKVVENLIITIERLS